jgi:hypothetical protein
METPCIRFDERFPTREDSDLYLKIMVYKPQGWPEYWTAQYRGAPKLILAENGYWGKVDWNHYQGCSYDHEHWRKRILHSHWKARDHDPDTYIFTEGISVCPDYSGLQRDTYDWAPVQKMVEEARELIEKGDYADRNQVWEVHQQLQEWVGTDDPFWNQWYGAFRRFDWPRQKPLNLNA